ncbi:MAG: TadE/TadG family type IV pilus assembly protein [Salaquimonas sp.]
MKNLILFSKFIKNTNGSFAMIAAIAVPIIVGTMGLVTDYVLFFDQKNKLQQAADVAALASVKELSLAGSAAAKSNQLQEVATAYALSAYYNNDADLARAPDISVEAIPDTDKGEVAVNLTYRWAPMFAQFFDGRVTPIKVSAKAKLAGNTLTCVVGLMPPQSFAKSSIHLENNAILDADGCAVYSNSTSRFGLRADGSAKMTAQSICTAGGVLTIGSAKFSPQPITDCPKIEDPLLSRSVPTYNGCSAKDTTISETTTLDPGVYCGGITITGDSNVTLNPGLYVIKDGPLVVSENASFIGKGVSFFLTGPNSVFDFQANTTIDLSAMEKGPTAGLLFYEDRSVPHSFDFNPFLLNKLPADVRLHRITSNDARNLLGTIYLSKSIVLVDADSPVADASAYTAIITGRLWLREGPILTLNADYTDTTVPVPDGIMGTEPVLIK